MTFFSASSCSFSFWATLRLAFNSCSSRRFSFSWTCTWKEKRQTIYLYFIKQTNKLVCLLLTVVFIYEQETTDKIQNKLALFYNPILQQLVFILFFFLPDCNPFLVQAPLRALLSPSSPPAVPPPSSVFQDVVSQLAHGPSVVVRQTNILNININNSTNVNIPIFFFTKIILSFYYKIFT